MILDGDKGAQNGIASFGPNINYARCYWHMAKNVLKKHRKQAREYFWELVYTQSREQFLIILGRIERDCGIVSYIL
jgi:transposase-like protein